MPKRKYTPSPETIQDHAEARAAGFIRAEEACEVLGVHRSRLAVWATENAVDARRWGREIWYDGSAIDHHLRAEESTWRARRKALRKHARGLTTLR